MTLEELIYKRFTEYGPLTSRLTRYQGRPAVFSPAPPEDIRDKWEESEQYPRIVYSYDMQANTERKTAGTLNVELYCQNRAETVPEDIAPEIRKCLKDILLKAEDGSLYAFAWSRTDAFEIRENKNDLIIGCDVRFDILEFTNQETTDPDPIIATSRYIKRLYPDCIVVGLDHMEDITEATVEKPVLYCELTSVEKGEESYSVTWMNGVIAVHIFCPDSSVRMKMSTALANRISLDGEIILLDTSPMFIRNLRIDNKSDYLKEGQLFITGRYGLLRHKQKRYTLNHAPYRHENTNTINQKGGMNMATEKKAAPEEAQETKATGQGDTLYSVTDFASQAKKLFGTTPEAVTVAFHMAGIENATIEEAKKTVSEFLQKEVG